jgi:hypothetical protein
MRGRIIILSVINYPRHLIRPISRPIAAAIEARGPGSPPGGQVAERNEIQRRLHSLLEVDERRPRGPITLPKLKPLER